MSHSAELYLKNYFLPHKIKEWNKLGSEIRNAETYDSFRKMLLNFRRPIGRSTYKIYDPLGIKLLSRIRLGFSYLSGHKFRHNFAWLTESVMFLFFGNWVYTSFFSTLPKLYCFTQSSYDYWFKNYIGITMI